MRTAFEQVQDFISLCSPLNFNVATNVFWLLYFRLPHRFHSFCKKKKQKKNISSDIVVAFSTTRTSMPTHAIARISNKRNSRFHSSLLKERSLIRGKKKKITERPTNKLNKLIFMFAPFIHSATRSRFKCSDKTNEM